MSQADARRRFDAIVGLYTEFLMERGVDLYHDEPPPVYEDYLQWYLSDGPTHLATANGAWRTQMAYQAWLDASCDREVRIAWATLGLIMVYSLAGNKATMEVFHEHKGSVPAELVLNIRRDSVRCLWQNQLWCEPWCSLVNQEFPGPEPSAKDLEDLEAFGKNDEDTDREWMERLDEAKAILFEHGYLPGSEENELVFRLVMKACILIAFSRVGTGEDISVKRPELEALVVEQSSNPSHPAWAAVIDRLITVKSLC